ncbi:MAG: hypothetical protein ABSC77_10045 [Terracidiphilus sp.]|jgi:hypothetical protein
MKTLRLLASVLVLTAFSASIAQQVITPPPKPATDAPANTAVLKLLQVGMPESVVLDKIHVITDKFDTSIDALIVLKQAGATEAELKAILAQGTAPAQPDAPPANTGPSLAETMQFIQEKLNGIGKVSYVDVFYAAVDGTTAENTYTDEISNVVADPSQCHISYHRKAIQNGKTYRDKENEFSMRDVQEIVVKPLEQFETESAVNNGITNVSITTRPPMTILEARLPHDMTYTFRFADADHADRVAKAMLHAVELCGGGNKDKF